MFPTLGTTRGGAFLEGAIKKPSLATQTHKEVQRVKRVHHCDVCSIGDVFFLAVELIEPWVLTYVCPGHVVEECQPSERESKTPEVNNTGCSNIVGY